MILVSGFVVSSTANQEEKKIVKSLKFIEVACPCNLVNNWAGFSLLKFIYLTVLFFKCFDMKKSCIERPI